LTMLYRSTDRLCRCGAPMKNLAHSASFESLDKNAPSNAGTKQLGFWKPSPASPNKRGLVVRTVVIILALVLIASAA
jgi:hypothetical protein